MKKKSNLLKARDCPQPYKRVFKSEERAQNWVDAAMKRGTPISGIYPYQCECGLWHLTMRHPERRVDEGSGVGDSV